MAVDWQTSLSLDIGTLFIIAICVTLMLGVLLLLAWRQERIPALAWFGVAYLIGALSGAAWRFGDLFGPALPPSVAHSLLFVTVGMIWSAARLFHGRRVRWGAMFAGAVVWLLASMVPLFSHSTGVRIGVSSLIVAGYTFLIAAELWRERRKSLIRRWPAIFVPMLHGAIFLFPLALATLSRSGEVFRSLAAYWIAVFVVEIVLYVVGAAFIVLILAKDRTVRFYKMAAATDPLTGVLNRRGVLEGAAIIMDRSRSGMAPVSVLAFDLDRFKSINDQFGHAVGDATLKLFATVVRKTMRDDDVIGRLGGEEFVAVLPSALSDAAAVAERVRAAFAAAGIECEGHQLRATVSAGVSCGSPLATIEAIIARADAALYRAKMNGRDRVEVADAATDERPERRVAARSPASHAVALLRPQ
jgi:diguanylate cyclase (GGDEF)-like protein